MTTYIDFGWPIQYNLKDLIKNLFYHITRHKVTSLSIDSCGKNHKGYEVFIPIEKTMELLKKAIILRNKLINKDKKICLNMGGEEEI